MNKGEFFFNLNVKKNCDSNFRRKQIKKNPFVWQRTPKIKSRDDQHHQEKMFTYITYKGLISLIYREL